MNQSDAFDIAHSKVDRDSSVSGDITVLDRKHNNWYMNLFSHGNRVALIIIDEDSGRCTMTMDSIIRERAGVDE